LDASRHLFKFLGLIAPYSANFIPINLEATMRNKLRSPVLGAAALLGGLLAWHWIPTVNTQDEASGVRVATGQRITPTARGSMCPAERTT